MSRITIAPIVEGHGEDQAVRMLLQKIWMHIGGEHAEVMRAIRAKRHSLVKEKEFERAIGLALLKLAAAPRRESHNLVLVLLDADEDLPCVLGPRLSDMAKRCRGDADVSCVVANVEYETWFVAAAESLVEFLNLEDGAVPEKPEDVRAGKGWIASRFKAPGKYSETVDQPRMSARMDIVRCRERAPSFDKLCRELELRLKPA